ncbi:MAG: DUF4340 domain-containing protein [Verrucomicrobiota bacterium]
MNTKHTLWLVALAVGLFSYIYFFERNAPGPQPEAWAARLLPDLDPLAVRSMEISRTNQLIRAERADGHWQLVTPFYPAQPAGLEHLLTALSRLSKRAFITSQELLSEPGGRKAFGLDPPQVSVVLEQGTNLARLHRVRLQIGGKTPLANQIYVQLVGVPGVYVTDAEILDAIPASANDWRDPLLLNLAGLPFDRLQIRTGARVFEVQRDPTNQLWRINKPVPARADPARVELLLQQLQNARVTQFVTDIPTVDLEQYGLQTPAVEVTFGQETNTLLVVEFGKSPTNNLSQVYARRLSHTNIVLVPKELLDPLRQPYKAFHDPRLIAIAPAAVDRIEIQANETFALRRQTNGVWQLSEPFPFAADALLVSEFLTNLNSLEIVDFAKDVATDLDLAQHGLVPPVRRYVLQAAVTNAAGAATNALLAQIDFGTNHVDTICVRRSDESSIYLTRLGDSLLLPRFAFELRDRHLWNLPSSNIISVTSAHKDKSQQMIRGSGNVWSPDTIKNVALEETLFRLGQLHALSWVTRGDQKLKLFGFPEIAQQLTLELKAGDKTETLSVEFGHRSPRGNVFACTRLAGEAERLIFEFPGRLYQDILRDFPFPAAGASP